MRHLVAALLALACTLAIAAPGWAQQPVASPAGFSPINTPCLGAVGEACVPLAQGTTTVPIGGGTSGTVQIVALTAAKSIYVTAGLVMPNASGTVKFVTGTGTNCGTGTADLTDAMTVTAQAAFKPGFGLGVDIIVPAGQALCITTSANNIGLGYITYVKR